SREVSNGQLLSFSPGRLRPRSPDLVSIPYAADKSCPSSGTTLQRQRPSARSIRFRDARFRPEDVSAPVRHEEIAAGDPGGGGVRPDEDVHPVVALPQRPDLHPAQIPGVAQGAQDVGDDGGGPPPRRFLPGVLLVALAGR